MNQSISQSINQSIYQSMNTRAQQKTNGQRNRPRVTKNEYSERKGTRIKKRCARESSEMCKVVMGVTNE